MENIKCSFKSLAPRVYLVFALVLSLVVSTHQASAVDAFEDYYIFQVNNKKGLRNSRDKILIPAMYEDLGWSVGDLNPLNDILGYKENGKWGLITLKNKKITTPQYLALHPINQQWLIASTFDSLENQQLFGIIDHAGEMVLSFDYGYLETFNNLLIASKKTEHQWQFGLINLEYQEVLPFKYSAIRPLSSQYAMIMDRDFMGLIDGSGQMVVTPKYHEIDLQGREFRGKVYDSYEIKTVDNKLLGAYQLQNMETADVGILIGTDLNQSQLLNTKGDILRTFKSARLSKFQHGLAVINQKEGYGVINSTGDIIMPPTHQYIWLDGQHLGVQFNNSKWRLFNAQLEQISNRDYQELKPAGEGFFAFKRQNSWGFANGQGEEVIPPQYQEVGSFENNVAYANYLGSWGLIDASGNWLIMPRYSTLEKITSDTYLFSTATHYGLVKTDKSVVYRTTNPLLPTKTGVIEQGQDRQFALISLNGEKMLSLQYFRISPFIENPDYYLFQDSTGLGIFNIAQRTFIRDTTFQEMRTLDEGYIGVKINDQYGLVDLNGKLRIANRYQDIGVFSEEMLSVKIRGKWGFVDRLERLKVQPVYQSVAPFLNGLSIVSQKNKFGIINKKGKIILSVAYDRLERLPDGQFICKQGTKLGLVNKEGKVLLYPSYHSLEKLESGFLKVSRNGKQGIIDESGKTLIPMVYDDLVYDKFNDLYLMTRKNPWEVIKL